MSWFTTLLFGAAVGGSAIKCGLDNMDAMSKPFMTYSDGTKVYHDRKGRPFVNGELCYEKVEYDSDHMRHKYLIGSKTGKIYHDDWNDVLDKMAKEADKEKTKAISNGYAAYTKYSVKDNQYLTTEISTGKTIAKLENIGGKCRKWYRDPNAWYWADIKKGDPGIPITEEEFKKLNIVCGSHTATIISKETLEREKDYNDTIKRLGINMRIK